MMTVKRYLRAQRDAEAYIKQRNAEIRVDGRTVGHVEDVRITVLPPRSVFVPSLEEIARRQIKPQDLPPAVKRGKRRRRTRS